MSFAGGLARRRAHIATALGAAALLLVTGTLVTAASARASESITASASSPPTSAGELSISFTAATAITSFTVHILTPNGTDVLDLPEADFTMTSPPGMASSTWALGQAITTSQLPLGTYSITVDATDAGNDSVTGELAGALDYLILPTVTLTASPAVLGYANPSTTLSGTVTGLRPDGSTGPLAGQDVVVTNSKGQAQQAQTDAEGDFRTSVSYPDTFTASVAGSTLASARSVPVTVTAATTPTRLTASAAPKRVRYGQRVTVSGKLSYKPGTAWQSLGGMPVVIDAPGGYPQLSIPVTATDGTYSATFTATESGPVLVYFNNAQYQESGNVPYLAPAEAETHQITVDRATTLTQFSASVKVARTVSVHGCVGIADLPAGSGGDVAGTVTIQYSASKAGPWHRLGKISKLKPAAGSSCGIATVEAAYTGSFGIKLARAYYRASFKPQAGLLSSVSAPVLAWKYLTQVKSLKVSARRLVRGRKLTISGRLWQDTKRWRPYAHPLVEIVYHKPRAKNSYWIVKVRTNSAGKFTARVTGTFSATWSAFYPGNATHYDSSSAGVKVTVR